MTYSHGLKSEVSKMLNEYTYKVKYLDGHNMRPREVFCKVVSKTTRACSGRIRDFMDKEIGDWIGAYEVELIKTRKVAVPPMAKAEGIPAK